MPLLLVGVLGANAGRPSRKQPLGELPLLALGLRSKRFECHLPLAEEPQAEPAPIVGLLD
jgi:hypothetical protein